MQLLGVYDEYLVEPLAQVLINLGVKRGMVVYGQDKLDEISLSAPTTICEMRDGWFKTEVITPEDFGFQRCTKEDLRGGTPAENAQITLNILEGRAGPQAQRRPAERRRCPLHRRQGGDHEGRRCPGGRADRLRQGAEDAGTAH